MAFKHAFCVLVTLTGLGRAFYSPGVIQAQPPQYVAVTPDTLYVLAHKLKDDLQNGSVPLADLHAMELRLALNGRLRETTSHNATVIEQQPIPEKNEPEMTVLLVPIADKLIQALEESDLDLAKKYSEDLATRAHAQHERYRQKQIQSSLGDTEDDRYFKQSDQLQEALWKGDIARAAILAADVQTAEKKLLTEKKLPAGMISKNAYDINDALGRAAFVRKNYLTASDYLLKAADNTGKNPALSSFGPDLWLAQALLKAGYRDVVLTFLERCRAFWSESRLDQWISVLQNGGVPDLTPNVFSHDPVLAN